MAAEFWGRECDLSDIHPRSPDVAYADAITRDYEGAGLVVTNPAFTIADLIRAKVTADGAHTMLCGPLMAFNDAGRARGMIGKVEHDWRQGFGILPDHAALCRAQYAEWLRGGKKGDKPLEVLDRSDSVTGFGLSSDGRHHGWGIWKPGSTTMARDFNVTVERSPEAYARAAPWIERAKNSAAWAEEITPNRPQLAMF